MSWTAPRVGMAVAAWSAGSILGLIVGAPQGWPLVGTLVGSAIGVVVVVVADARRGRRLLRWLRSAQQGQAPRDAGFWGEIGYWAEKALRGRERAIEIERKRREQFLSAIEASPNGVMMLDAEEHIDWCNKVGADHFGLDPERDRGQRVTNLIRSPAFKAYLTEGDFDEPVTIVGPRGRATLSVLVSPYGEGLKLVLSQDVTVSERAEAMRRDFVANVSHEIRTPLTVLAGFVETLSTLPLTPAERDRVLGLMRQQTNRMQVLVADLLMLAQLEGSPRPQADSWVDVDRLFEQAERDARALSAGRHVLAFVPSAGFELAGQDGELASALGNLLSNAVRYTPEGGKIEARWSTAADGSGVIEVSDTGPGIEREHLPRLTERFYRVDGSRSRDTGGTGLGLSIVKHVMQRHGGRIEIESTLGKGSVFRLLFPAARTRRLPRDAEPVSTVTEASEATRR